MKLPVSLSKYFEILLVKQIFKFLQIKFFEKNWNELNI
jgi:hypothetical protein